MPGLEVLNTSLASPGGGQHHHQHPPQLRAHKSLRRRPNVLWSPQLFEANPGGPNGRPSNNGAPLAPAPARPLTPPAVAQPDDDLTSDGTNTPKAVSSSSSLSLSTPKPSHPPTPETTPPQLSASAARPGLSHFGQSSASSRADSFRTACEMISDAETETPRRSSQSVLPTRHKSLRTDEPFDSDRSGDTTPIPGPRPDRLRAPMTEPPARGEMEETEPPRVSPPRRKKSTRNGARRIPRPADWEETRYGESDADVPSEEVPIVHSESPRLPARDLQEPVAGLSIEEFREQIDWPPTERRLHPADPDDVRRLSDVSTASTVEVMIIDPPQSTQRSLRHTEKRDSLRSIPRSEHASLASNPDSQRRLVHKAGRITEHDRKSIASEISISGASSMNLPPQNVDIVPVVVIPERRSSLKSSSSSRNTSQTRSRHSSRRGTTASGSRPGSREPPRQKKRTLSDNSNPGKGAEPRGRHPESGRPTVPARNSSLSAPTSRNNSRTTSLTSESLRDHTLAMEHDPPHRPVEKPPVHRPEVPRGLNIHDAGEASKTQSIIIGVEDMSHLRPPSMPYTQISIPSSSPGLIEVSEATTVTFFPHTNESLLLVDPQTQSTLRSQMPGPDYHRPDSPTPRSDLNFPLQNPRQPPKPPVCQVIPPTPVQDDPQPAIPAGKNKEASGRPGRRFGSARRPWMPMNRKAGKDIDGRLQPFWRPRRFWDDSEPASPLSPLPLPPPHSPSSSSPPSADADSDLIIKNSLGMPQQRVVFEGPPVAIPRRRLESHSHHANTNRGTLVNSQVFTPEAFCSQTSLHHHRYRSLSWWRLRLRAGKIRNIRRRVRRTWQRHADHRREAKREKLKQSISGAVLVESSTQLRGGDEL